jgi:hypothetical protein
MLFCFGYYTEAHDPAAQVWLKKFFMNAIILVNPAMVSSIRGSFLAGPD